jgi:L-serine/L-threonine ammonia-lyase
MPLHTVTPLIESRRLVEDRSIWLKLENTQPTGSFKIRGIGHACEEYAKRGARRFLSSSGGNAGLAVAYAGRTLGIPVTVVVPETTTETAKSLIQSEAAEVLVHGESWAEAHAKAVSMVEQDIALLHPFDDPLIWQGHASIVEEVACAGVRPDRIVVAVGGGGLLSGVIEGLERQGWGSVEVIAVETVGADSLGQSLAGGELVELAAINSIATSLGAKRVAVNAFKKSVARSVVSLLVSDREAVAACRAFRNSHHMLVEPACGAALAAANSLEPFNNDISTLVVVCGGVGVSLESLQRWEVDLKDA